MAAKTASINCGAGPSPGNMSLRVKKSEVMTGTPALAAAASSPSLRAFASNVSACFCATCCAF